MADELISQWSPYPTDLADIVSHLHCFPGWTFELDHDERGQGCVGLTLTIGVKGPDAYNPEQQRIVWHLFPVPAAAYNAASWRRWVFDRCVDIQTHEAMEWFRLEGFGDYIGAFRPYAPNHGPGHDPYVVRELSTDEERRTSFRGVVKPE